MRRIHLHEASAPEMLEAGSLEIDLKRRILRRTAIVPMFLSHYEELGLRT